MNVSPSSIPIAHPHTQPAHAKEKPSEFGYSKRDAAETKEVQHDKPSAGKRYSDEETKIINELAARDREVRAHEQAHAAVGGIYAGAPRYTFEQGPNGKKYAVGGEVSISTSPVAGDAEATIRKAEQVKRAALAPAQPSAQDRAVAAQATQMKIEAQVELREQKAAELAEQLKQSESDPDADGMSEPDRSAENGYSTKQSIANQLITSEFIAQEYAEKSSFQAMA
ncbi:MAG: putative metalloprotease CJM1_0395 family protein [Pseudomonadota bacterium]